jgi:hypothetical protein
MCARWEIRPVTIASHRAAITRKVPPTWLDNVAPANSCDCAWPQNTAVKLFQSITVPRTAFDRTKAVPTYYARYHLIIEAPDDVAALVVVMHYKDAIPLAHQITLHKVEPNREPKVSRIRLRPKR